ncbi:uncharacterized protein LOC108624576 [Ceratina calcarata]|uniref:Uncharacterized protein LOC108624576 n=1 Tax=Ceratina calcarata TaxID=156304 RepID=A0AAJ7N643_9HYME|nr:uncharacterized protein LOC108624576 [Ceratina calcarata]
MTESVNDAKVEVQASEFRNVKLPKFWKEEPRLWFIMLEREFAAYNNVKAEAIKCSAVLRNLDQATMKIVLDIIEALPEKSTYQDLKTALIERLAKSDEANLRHLLSRLELADRKPSELLREMMQLAGENVSENAVRTLWMQRLPVRVQEVLTILDGAELDRLSKVADKTIERSTLEVATVAGSSHAKMDAGREKDSELAAIIKRLSRIETQLARRSRSPWRRRFQRRQRSSSRGSNSENAERNGLCYFHHRFGTKAWKCKEPCAWVPPEKKKQTEN